MPVCAAMHRVPVCSNQDRLSDRDGVEIGLLSVLRYWRLHPDGIGRSNVMSHKRSEWRDEKRSRLVTCFARYSSSGCWAWTIGIQVREDGTEQIAADGSKSQPWLFRAPPLPRTGS
ncbi:hypothetical protein CFAM422_001666 [Trichoderma lentiforme]|uniref:Uncharacterized protein n=1 Tax=Trichoderma lentiforme TaxID=1567552 RepID=A0A9P4XPL7_9HYPO|nr:hypothetical protein CFAM422_001666 [Trichoderma lentiforme]